MIQSKMKFSANEQAKELITIFYPGSDIAQDMVDMAIGSRDDWRWERAIELSVKCCEKIMESLRDQPIIFTHGVEYWEDVKQILQNK
jgi:hypothetical protein